MLEFLGDALGQFLPAVAGGGLLGLFGTAITGVLAFFQKRQAHRHEVELRRLDIELARVEAAGFERGAEIEAEGEAERAALAAFQESYREAGRRWSRPGDGILLVLVDFCRGMTRPGLTWCLVGLTTVIYFTLGYSDPELKLQIVHTVLFLDTMTVSWWFGARHVARPAR